MSMIIAACLFLVFVCNSSPKVEDNTTGTFKSYHNPHSNLNASALTFTPRLWSNLNPLKISSLNPHARPFTTNLSTLNPRAKPFNPRICHTLKDNKIVKISTSFKGNTTINTNHKIQTPIFTESSYSDTEENDKESAFYLLKQLRIKNWKKIIIGHLNINSIKSKINLLADLIKGNVDVMVISETKLDNSFPTSQFTITGYSPPYRLDRNKHGGGLLLYVRNDIPSKQIKCSFSENIECIIIEINIWKKNG